MYYFNLSILLFSGRDARGGGVDDGLAGAAIRPPPAARAPDALNLREFCIAAPGRTPA
ncbi:hypothetical protein LGN30_09585 [Burkholderia seminalis]|uniref:hypothetical protein n=1 Tax=Burkholderia seminalis TaxID=488731 RepID=UPI001CF58AB6|nr:hypothetical protein [Burkholderia seminalis]MCA8423437.1 hypothetical protein [Burkholderia seminalis]